MDERYQALEIFAEQVIVWAQNSIAQEDDSINLSEAIVEFAASLGLPL